MLRTLTELMQLIITPTPLDIWSTILLLDTSLMSSLLKLTSRIPISPIIYSSIFRIKALLTTKRTLLSLEFMQLGKSSTKKNYLLIIVRIISILLMISLNGSSNRLSSPRFSNLARKGSTRSPNLPIGSTSRRRPCIKTKNFLINTKSRRSFVLMKHVLNPQLKDSKS